MFLAITIPAVPVSKGWSDWALWGAQITLSIVGLVGICYAYSTLKTIKRQTKAAEDAATAAKDGAEATLLNAGALISSERPWILVDIEHSTEDPAAFLIYGINKGNTPAELHEGHCSCKPHTPGFIPVKDSSDPFFAPTQNLIVSGERFPIGTIRISWIEEAMKDRPYEMMFVYGKITYWDTFTDRKRPGVESHSTQWSFAYDLIGKRFYRHAGDYTRNT